METLTLNRVGRVRKVREGGRDYLVAPLTLIVPGVLNGSRGALYYPPEQIANSVKIWNGCPLVVYHPTHNGKNVSARHPGVWDRSGVGQVRNPRISKGKLVAEGWFDAERARRVDPRVYNALMANERMEISTGLYTVNVPAPAGSVCPVGRPYTHIATDYRADHLAILPDQVGACSLSDGCGLMVANRYSHPTAITPYNRPPHLPPVGRRRPGAGLVWEQLTNAFDPNQPRDTNSGRWVKGPGRPMSTVDRRKALARTVRPAVEAVQRLFRSDPGVVQYRLTQATQELHAIGAGREPEDGADRVLGNLYEWLQESRNTELNRLIRDNPPSDQLDDLVDHLAGLYSDTLDELAVARQGVKDLRRNTITDWQVID
jgi:hypothetical protein